MIQITVLAFGQVATIVGNQLLLNENVPDTNALQLLLQQRFVALEGVKYSLAIDKKLVQQNTALHNGATVALLPPFSGG